MTHLYYKYQYSHVYYRIIMHMAITLLHIYFDTLIFDFFTYRV